VAREQSILKRNGSFKMLDQIIHKHLNKIDEIKLGVEKDIDSLIKEIDIDDVIENPEEILIYIVDILQELLLDKYAEDAVKSGIELSKAIAKDGEIVVDESKDPNLNKEDK
jgi:hypothetical protein